jgi:hypothetical protein
MASADQISLERVVRALESVRERLLKATQVLEAAGIAYAVAGGNAVASWVSSVNKAAVRFTQDLDIIVRRDDFPAVISAMSAAGYHYARVLSVEMFLDSIDSDPSDAVHILFAGEKVKPTYEAPVADVTDSNRGDEFQVLKLEALVRMKLTSYRRKDQVHLQDMIRVRLIDATWPARFPPVLAARLQELIDDPDG